MDVLANGQERYAQLIAYEGSCQCILGCLATTHWAHGKCSRHLATVPHVYWPQTARARNEASEIAARFQTAELDVDYEFPLDNFGQIRAGSILQFYFNFI